MCKQPQKIIILTDNRMRQDWQRGEDFTVKKLYNIVEHRVGGFIHEGNVSLLIAAGVHVEIS